MFSFCKRVLNSRICQHCDVKTSTVTPTFYYLFIIFLTCYISVPSFIYNLCYVLLLRNHLKPPSLIQGKKVNKPHCCFKSKTVIMRKSMVRFPAKKCYLSILLVFSKLHFPRASRDGFSALTHPYVTRFSYPWCRVELRY